MRAAPAVDVAGCDMMNILMVPTKLIESKPRLSASSSKILHNFRYNLMTKHGGFSKLD